MIETHQAYEAALESALALLAEPPEPGGAEHEDFLRLLHNIQAYADRAPPVADDGPFALERAELTRRLKAYEVRYKNEEQLAHDHHEGHGVGPTPFVI